MTTQEAMKILEGLVPAYSIDSGECQVVGLAVAALLWEGYHDFEWESTDSGGLILRTGDIELLDDREDTPRGEVQRHVQLLVRAAVKVKEVASGE